MPGHTTLNKEMKRCLAQRRFSRPSAVSPSAVSPSAVSPSARAADAVLAMMVGWPDCGCRLQKKSQTWIESI